MLEGSQFRLLIKLNKIPLLSVYLSQSKGNGGNFHMMRQLQEAFDNILTYLNDNSRRMHCSEAVL